MPYAKLTDLTPAERFERLVSALVVKNKRYRRATLSKGTEVFIAYGESPVGDWDGLIGFVTAVPHAQQFTYDGNMSESEVEQEALKYAEQTSVDEIITTSYAVH